MNEKKNGYNKQTQKVYNDRIKNYATRALRDLTLPAQKLPEKQQAIPIVVQVFQCMLVLSRISLGSFSSLVILGYCFINGVCIFVVLEAVVLG